jgi:hypothetical protein
METSALRAISEMLISAVIVVVNGFIIFRPVCPVHCEINVNGYTFAKIYQSK